MASSQTMAGSAFAIICWKCGLVETDRQCIGKRTHHCSTCYEKVHAEPAFEGHESELINQERAEMPSCNEHCNEKLKFWCDKCEELICRDCVMFEHRDHKIVRIDTMAPVNITEIQFCPDGVQSSLDYRMKQAKELIIASKNLTIETITTVLESIRGMITNYVDAPKRWILEIERGTKGVIEDIQTKLTEKQDELRKRNDDFTKPLQDLKALTDYLDKADDELYPLNRLIPTKYYIKEIDQLQTAVNNILKPIRVVAWISKRHSLIICNHWNHRMIRWLRRNGANVKTIIPDTPCWGVAMDNDGSVHVMDIDKHEVRRYRMNQSQETIMAVGNRLNQLNYPTDIFVEHDHSVFVSDYDNHRVMKWIKGAKEVIVMAAGQGQGNSLSPLSFPGDVLVAPLETIYVANHRIVRWPKRDTQGNVIAGETGPRRQVSQFPGPDDLRFNRHGHLYVDDCWNKRIQRFTIELTDK